MALNIRKVAAQSAENNQKFIKRQFLYYFNKNCLFIHQTLCPGLAFIILPLFNTLHNRTLSELHKHFCSKPCLRCFNNSIFYLVLKLVYLFY